MSSSQTLAELLAPHIEGTPTKPALLDTSGRALSFGELGALFRRVHGQLAALGIHPGDSVGIVLPNSMELGALALCMMTGAAAAPLNPTYSRDENTFYLTDLAAKALVVLEGDNGAAVEAARSLNVPVVRLVKRPGSELFELVFPGSTSSAKPRAAQADDVGLVLHTSGTTSRPKMVPLRQRNLSASAKNVRSTLSLGASDRSLDVMPLFHIHGLVAGLLAPLSAGASVICAPSFAPDAFFDWLREGQPTYYSGVPTMHQAILARASHHKDAVAGAKLRFIRSSSSALPSTVLEQLESVFKVPVIEAYGMTEAAHQMASNPLPPGTRKPLSVGLAAGPEVGVMDDNGMLLPSGAEGELVIRGVNVMTGYASPPEANATAFKNGWFRTGDQGKIDSDGFIFLTGRLKEMINRGGEKVAPAEVDNVLLRHPAVAQAATFAVPHPTLGEEVAAVVVLRPGVTPAPSAQELHRFAGTKLAPYKTPKQILIRDEIPKGPTGKLQRVSLAKTLFGDKQQPQQPAAKPAPSAPAPDGVEYWESALLKAWSEVLERAEIGLTDNLFLEHGADSLSTMRVIVSIEKATGRRVDPAMFLRESSITLQAAQLRGAPTASDKASVKERSPVITMQDGSDAHVPLFLVHQYGGQTFPYLPLVRAMDRGRAIHIFESPSLHDMLVTFRSVEDFADSYVHVIEKVWPRGPLILGGHSFGGSIAFEIALRLTSRGREVRRIEMLDSLLFTHTARAKIAGLKIAAHAAVRVGSGHPMLERLNPLRRDKFSTPVQAVKTVAGLIGLDHLEDIVLWGMPSVFDRASMQAVPPDQRWRWMVARIREHLTPEDEFWFLPGVDAETLYRALREFQRNFQLAVDYTPSGVFNGPVSYFSSMKASKHPARWRRYAPHLEERVYDVKRVGSLDPHQAMLKAQNVELFAKDFKADLVVADRATT